MLDFSKLYDYEREGRICAVNNDDVMSYGDLNRYTAAISAEIRSRVPDDGSPVLMVGDKENLFIAGLLSAMYCGHPYVAVSAAFPFQRIREIAGSCGASMVMNFSGETFERFMPCWLDIEELRELAVNGAQRDAGGAHVWSDDELMAVFFTSGSTGKPKGVKISYGNMRCVEANREFYTQRYLHYEKGEQPVLLNFSSYGFIASTPMIICDIFNNGAKLYAIGKDKLADFSLLMEYIRDIDPTHFTCTPSFLELCLRNDAFRQENLPRLKVIFSGGGPVSVREARSFRDRFSAELINVYGATELTGSALCFPVSQLDDDAEGFVPSGFPVADTEAVVMDNSGVPCADGQTGELYITGSNVAAGYYNSDYDPFFTAEDGRRWYRTSDLYVRRNGLLYYKGRTDGLVKVGSYRVELFDVEKNLALLPEVKEAVVVPCRENEEVRMLTAYIILNSGYEPKLATTLSIKKQLRSRIQTYAVPQVITYLKSFPLTVSAKPDRKELERAASEAAFG